MADKAEWQDFNGGKAKNTIVHFYEKEVQNPGKSLQEGRPIYETRIFIEKITPGDKLNRIDRQMRDADKQEFPDEWQKFERKESHQVEGTPLEAWPLLSRRQAMEFKAMEIHTVEHLAGVSDSVGSKIMGFNDLRRSAQNFLKTAQDSAFADRLAKDNEEKDRQLKEQAEAIKELQSQMAQMTKKKKRGAKSA